MKKQLTKELRSDRSSRTSYWNFPLKHPWYRQPRQLISNHVTNSRRTPVLNATRSHTGKFIGANLSSILVTSVVYLHIQFFLIRRLRTQHWTKSKIRFVDADVKQINQGTNPLRGHLATGKYCQYVDLIVITQRRVVTTHLSQYLRQRRQFACLTQKPVVHSTGDNSATG
jgi:hypothetical protein